MTHFIVLMISALFMGVNLADVVTLAHPEEELPPAKTVVWSPLFQATWEAVKEKSGGQPIRIDPPNKLMEKLDAFRFDAKSVMPDDSWKVWAGPATQEFLNQVNQEAAVMTKEKDGPFRMEGGSPGSVAAFGLLNRQIVYSRAFYRSQKKPMVFAAPGGPAVSQFFGVAGELSSGFGASVRILSYDPTKKSYAVGLLSKDGLESVVLYLPQTPQNFAAACETIQTQKANYHENVNLRGAIDDPILHRNDSIRVPYLTLAISSAFPELMTSGRYPADGGLPWRVYRAEQITRFDLHDQGARVSVTASSSAEPFGGTPPPPPTVPRDFIYDRPFFVFLWREKAEWPYFAAWIGDASALQPFK